MENNLTFKMMLQLELRNSKFTLSNAGKIIKFGILQTYNVSKLKTQISQLFLQSKFRELRKYVAIDASDYYTHKKIADLKYQPKHKRNDFHNQAQFEDIHRNYLQIF
jgi:hypothetical protein